MQPDILTMDGSAHAGGATHYVQLAQKCVMISKQQKGASMMQRLSVSCMQGTFLCKACCLNTQIAGPQCVVIPHLLRDHNFLHHQRVLYSSSLRAGALQEDVGEARQAIQQNCY